MQSKASPLILVIAPNCGAGGKGCHPEGPGQAGDVELSENCKVQ